MKLKYYLRGLAVGMILTTIILTIANADNKPMTDAQVRKRALELGMIESDSLKLGDVGTGTEPAGSEEETESMEPSTESGMSAGSAETSTESEVSSVGSAEVSKEPQASTGNAESSVATESSAESTEPIVFTIRSGDNSYSVSKALAAVGLVEDAVEYDNYLCDNGYSRRIRTGTYEILPGMSYEEIAEIITR